ncbi:MAG: hypothetical protein Q8N57_01785, partial [bacterium]|nr:hypothetical protein [bacterium]
MFALNLKTVQAYHATSSYNKLYNDTLTSENWNDLFSDFVNNRLPVSLNGPVGIATAAPSSGLEVNGIIRGGSFFSSGSVGIGTTSPSVLLQVAPTSGAYSILAAAAGGAYRIGNVDDPSIDSDATNKYYVDSAISSATTSMITMPIGTNGQTLRNNSGTWMADSFLYKNGTSIGIGTTVPGTAELSVVGDLLVDLPAGGTATFTEDPTGATSTGKIQLGRSGGSWESVSFDPSLGSHGKFVFTAPLQIAASSPGITFYDSSDPTNTAKQRSIEYNATDLQLKIGDSFKTNFGTNTGMPPSSKVFFQIGPNDLFGTGVPGIFIGANSSPDFIGDLLHFQVGGATRFRVTKFGDI